MYSDMPPLVDQAASVTGGWNFPSSPPPLAPSRSHPSAGGTPWASTPILPGGFGAGVPAPGLTPAPTPHPLQQQQRHRTPGRRQGAFSRSPSMGHNAIHPMLAPQHTQVPGAGGVSPFSFPAAAFDPPGFQYPAGAPGASPPPLGMPSPWHTTTPRTHQQDPEDNGDDDFDSPPALGGWGFGGAAGNGGGGDPYGWPRAFGHQSPGSGSSSGAMPSPSASVINGFASGPRSQYKRPSDWREGFSMSRPGPLTRVFSFGKGSKGNGLFSKPALHKIIDAREHLCSWDVRFPPDHFYVLDSATGSRVLSYLELQEGAMKPEPVRMKLFHPMLPWTIEVSAGGPGSRCVVTIGHLIATIHAELMRPVFQSDFWNAEVSEEDRKKIYAAWEVRCKLDRATAERGIKRVDYLCERVMFEGLRRVDDCWEMKLKSKKM